MSSEPSEIAVIVVNYGTADLALAAVESVVTRDHGGRRVEVHLVDNASPDGDAELLRKTLSEKEWGPQVHFYPEPINHGFGRGNTVVLKRLAERDAVPDKVFFLNPDAEVHDSTIEDLAAFLDTRPEVGMVGCAIKRPETDDTVCSAFRFPGALAEFSTSAGLGVVQRALSRWQVSLPTDQPSGQVDWVSGAAMMARMEAIREIDFFDPDFFLYFDEVEMMYRLAKRNWKVWYLADTGVSHIAGAATGLKESQKEGRAPLPGYWFDSWQLYFTKCHGTAYALLCATARLSGWTVNQLARRLMLRQPDVPRRFARDFLKGSVRPILFGGQR